MGGNPYLLPVVHRDKIYDLKNIVQLVKSDPAFVIGPGAGPHPHIGRNCEVKVFLFHFYKTVKKNIHLTSD